MGSGSSAAKYKAVTDVVQTEMARPIDVSDLDPKDPAALVEEVKRLRELIRLNAGDLAAADQLDKAALAESQTDSKEDQLAKCMGNLEFLRRELNTPISDERREEIQKEVRGRKDFCKQMRAEGVVPSPAVVVFNQIDVNKNRRLDTAAIKRLVDALTVVYGSAGIETPEQIVTTLDIDRSGDVDIFEWCSNVQKLPGLYKALCDDLDPDWGSLRSYRTVEDQLAKCMGNLERLRRELLTPNITDERKAAIEKDMRERKNMCKSLRAKGVVPSPGYVVFNQIDMNKTRKIGTDVLKRLINSLTTAYKKAEIEPIEKIMQVMDADRSGDIDEAEWVDHLKKLPLLYKVLQQDVDPDWGTLRCYRTFEDQLAKNMGNLERLRHELQRPDTTDERKEEIKKLMRARKDECKAFIAKGIVPSPAYVVFNQIDVDKSRTISVSELQRMLKGLMAVYSTEEIEPTDKIMRVMDADRSGDIDEAEWVQNLKKLPLLHAVLQKDVDPKWGTIRSYRTLEDQLAKLFGNIARLEAKEQDEATAKELADRKAQAAKLRARGVIPSPGTCIFSQLDVNKDRKLSKDELAAALAKVAPGADIDGWFAKLVEDGTTEVDEATWIKNVKHIPDLVQALTADMDADTGRLKSC